MDPGSRSELGKLAMTSARHFLMFAEAPSDFRRAAILVDRVLCEENHWLVDHLNVSDPTPSEESKELRKAQRGWVNENGLVGEEGGNNYADIHHLDPLAKELNRKRGGFHIQRGKFEGTPGEKAAKLGRKAFAIGLELRKIRGGELDAILVIMDMDNQPERKAGLDQARNEARNKEPTVTMILGCPSESMEAWGLASLHLDTTDGQDLLRRCMKEHLLTANPCEQAHLLSHKENVPRSSKAILGVLTRDNPEEPELSLRTAALSLLRERGAGSGLADFLDELKELCRLFG